VEALLTFSAGGDSEFVGGGGRSMDCGEFLDNGEEDWGVLTSDSESGMSKSLDETDETWPIFDELSRRRGKIFVWANHL